MRKHKQVIAITMCFCSVLFVACGNDKKTSKTDVEKKTTHSVLETTMSMETTTVPETTTEPETTTKAPVSNLESAINSASLTPFRSDFIPAYDEVDKVFASIFKDGMTTDDQVSGKYVKEQ